MKRRKVSTFMGDHPQGCTPKMIALGTGLNVNTVKSILPKLSNIQKIARGLYKVVNRGDSGSTSTGDLHAWNFHNLILSFPVEKLQEWDRYQLDYDLIKLSFYIKDLKCTMTVSTDYPINVSSICLLFAFIRTYFRSNVTMDQITVKTIEFNQDHANLKLDGVQSITLDSLCAQFKLYQKSIGLRAEHKTKVRFTAENMVDMLTGSATAVDLSKRMTDQDSRLKKLTGQTVYNTKLLNKLVEGMR